MATNSISPSTKSSLQAFHERAAFYLGRRIFLRKEVEALPKLKDVLDAHTSLMLSNNKTMKGCLYQATFRGKKVYILGTTLMKVMSREDAHKTTTDDRAQTEYLDQMLPSFIKRLISSSSKVCVQFDFRNPTNNHSFPFILSKETTSDDPCLVEAIDHVYLPALSGVIQWLGSRNSKPLLFFDSNEGCNTWRECLETEYSRNPYEYYFSKEFVFELMDAVQWNHGESLTEINKQFEESTKTFIIQRGQHVGEIIFSLLSGGENVFFAPLAELLPEAFSCLQAKGVDIQHIDF